MDDESVEQMLGMGNMKEIMKELNQQGARAGIVFAGLSQNVDELRRQLGVASEAYEENIAIQQEYDKMNETTAAKWERLKNRLEEMFVGDKSQRFFGGIIDNLRTIVDIVADAYNSWMIYIAALYAAFKAVDTMGRFMCIGFFAMIATQTIFNIGMCISVLPVIGITLPFFSAGGSSSMCLYFGVGIVQSVYMRTMESTGAAIGGRRRSMRVRYS